tara:strand:- start:3487 stop:3861 length:375 start_codon:yes stop_codon:yes gene_type:complete
MATLTPSLTLKMDYSSTGGTTGNLVVSVDDSLTVTNPSTNLARISVSSTGATNLRTTSESAITYVYLKNISESNVIVVKTDGAVAFADLNPGEFAFLPLKGAVGLEVQSDAGTCILEYGYWTKG